MLKFATFEVISSVLVAEGATPGQAEWFAGQNSPFSKTAHRAHFDYEPRPGYLYVRSRAISSRCNDNFDEFPAEEIKKAYSSFVGKPVFVNHNNENHRRMRGVVIDAALHEDRNPDGSPDTWAEVLMEVDAKRFPKLAEAIVKGHIERTSMGTDVKYSICSACNNKATNPSEYCQHIPRMKGSRIYRPTAGGRKEGVLIREICYGLGFFENSLLVEPPADPTAFMWGLDTRGLDKAASLDLKTRPTNDLGLKMKQTDDTCPGCYHDLDRHHVSRSGTMECNTCACHRPLSGAAPGHTGAKTAGPMSTTEDRSGGRHKGRVTDSCAKCGSDIYQLVGEKNWQHDIDAGAGVPHMAEPGGMGKSAAVGPKYPDSSQHPSWKSTKLHPDHVVEHYNASTDAEKAAGKSWYSDAHHLAKTIAGDHPHPKGAAHVGAGVLSAYSPQNNWPANIFAAHRSFREGRAIGPGEGPTVMGMHQRAAAKIMGGEDHQVALKGPKTQDFASLIEHGGNKEGDRKRVVIDRHALSVAAGRRVPKEEANSLGSAMGNRHYYEHAAGVYRKATDTINKGKPEDEHVEPHQVQAVTWLVRQRRNAAEDDANESSAYRNRAKGRQNAERNTRGKMQDELLQHHPEMKDNSHVQSSRRLAFGETKAPADVDTLRDEECPVCGEHDSYDGNRCQVCGFIAPPAMFQDPDLDLAKKLDLRKDVQQDAGTLPGQPDNGGLPAELPGEEVPGSDAVPMDPSMVNPDGTVTPTTDPDQIVDQQAEQLLNGEPLDPAALGPDGQPVLNTDESAVSTDDPDAIPGQPEEPEPEVPGGPSGPEDPLTEQAEGVDPGAQPAELAGDPGTPDDGAPDLACPACGFQTDAAQPASTNMDLPEEPPVADGGDGMVAGDVCPRCQKAQLVSVGELAQAGAV